MTEEFIPELTLDPVPAAAPAATAAAVAAEEAPAPAEAPAAEAAAAAGEAEEESGEVVSAAQKELSSLSPAQQAAILAFAEKIDITNTEQISNYGAKAQQNISEFSDAALRTVRTKDLGQAGTMLGDLVVELKGLNFDAEEKKGLRGLFKKGQQSLASLKAQVDKVEVNVDKIVEALEQHELTLLKDIAMMDKMYERNLEYQKELTMYILAGKLKIEQLRREVLPALVAKAQESGLPEDAQAANDFANMIGRFEKKIHDLELTRMIAIQMAPQIRMVQNNDRLMAEKIRSSIVNTIPLWKNQMVMAMSLHHSEQAMKAEREVTNVTNKLLEQNAQALHQGSVAIAREAERGIVDIETLKKTNDELIATLTEVRQIQDEGRAKRAEAEKELVRIEDVLRQKLLEMKG